MNTMRYAMMSGALAGLFSLAAVTATARMEGKGALQPVNATSHWLHGDAAGGVHEPDLRHTAVGLLTHAASAAFWALPFALWLDRRPPRGALDVVCRASALSAFAALFDYGVIHRRLTPGWELAVSRRGVACTFAAMAVGLAAGALAARRNP